MDILLRKSRHRRPHRFAQLYVGVVGIFDEDRSPGTCSLLAVKYLSVTDDNDGSSDSRVSLASQALDTSRKCILPDTIETTQDIQSNATQNAGSPQYTLTLGNKRDLETNYSKLIVIFPPDSS